DDNELALIDLPKRKKRGPAKLKDKPTELFKMEFDKNGRAIGQEMRVICDYSRAKLGSDSDPTVNSYLADCLVRKEEFLEAYWFYANIIDKDPGERQMEDSYSRIVYGLIRINEIKKALHLIDELTSNQVFQNLLIFTLVFKGLLLENRVMDMRSLYFSMTVKQNIHTNFTFYRVFLVNLARNANKLDVYMILSEISR
nr:hypothetical protein [Tanacetum cinerariifolium]